MQIEEPIHSSLFSLYPKQSSVFYPKESPMEFHSRFESDTLPMQMAKELHRICNSRRGGTIEQSFLYSDGISAAGWTDICNQEDYYTSYDGSQSLAWVADAIYDHLGDSTFDKTKIDIIGLGPGDARKELKLTQSLLDLDPNIHINCHLIERSYPLMVAAHHYLQGTFEKTGRVSIREWLADFWKLPYLSDLFDSKESEETLRVVCMFGYTFGNLDGELRFVRDSLRALKPGDILLMDVILAYAPHNNHEAIRNEDPRLASRTIWQSATEHWLATTLQRHRTHCGDLIFENVLSTTTSAIPNTYTIEVHAEVVDEGKNNNTRFNVLRLHRYEQESFIAALAKEGFKRMGGKSYGLKRNCLRYLFTKE